MAKEVVYIEADDEITTVIDKVVSAKDDIIAVVLPKRATVFQSVVNMRLLKKAATESKKRIVLISSESSIESIAAVALVHVAQSLTSKPSIPKKPKALKSDTTISSSELEDSDSNVDEDVDISVGEEVDEAKYDAENDTIELDNTEEDATELPTGTLAKEEPKLKKSKFKIPDFSSFRLRMTLGILAVVLLVVGWFFGFVVMPKATVTINTNTSTQPITFEFSAQTAVTEVDKETSVIPAIKAEITKEDKATVSASGEKNMGEKATGTVTLTNCKTGASGVSIPAGTSFSSGSLTFVTTEDIDLGPAVIIGTCRSADFPAFGAVGTVATQATQPGTDYNLSARSLTSSVEGVSAYSSATTGGTTNVVKVVSSSDIEKAKDQLKGTATSGAIDELKKKLSDQQLQALVETLESSDPKIKPSVAADSEATEVTVTQTVTYTMLGISSNDLGSLLDFKLEELLKDSADKNVRNNGLSSAVYRLATKASADSQTISIQTVAVLGADFDENAIKKEIVGKKRGDIEKIIEAKDGVGSVSVEYSPGWITTTPKSEKKITIKVIETEN